ncbi:polycystin-2, partial [Plakobranchus ocellatus]
MEGDEPTVDKTAPDKSRGGCGKLIRIAFGMSSTTMFYYTKVLMDLFIEAESKDGVSFRSITSVEDFWKFTKGPLLDGLYWDKWYNGQDLPPSTEGYIYYENKLLGVPRLRQLRVSTNSCTVNSEFASFITDCYSMYTIDQESKEAFGPYFGKKTNDTALLVEFPATGGAQPSWSFNTVKLIRYVTDFDKFIMGCEVVFCIFILYYIIEEIIEIFATGLKYFADFWNVLDIVLIGMALICIIFNVHRTVTIVERLGDLLNDPGSYANFVALGFWEMRFNNIVAITVFFAWVKVFKYISFNKTMTQLSTTLSRCAKDLLGFFIMFFIVFLAFTQLGYLLFGTQVNDFSTFMNSFFTLFRIVLGDFDFHQLEQANRILGPIFFMLFVFFVFFVLINMFLAIINDTYSEVKSDMAKQTDVFIMADYIKQGYAKFRDKFGFRREKLEGYEQILAGDLADKKMTVSEWKEELQKTGFDEGDIDETFTKFDVDGDRILDVAEQKHILQELQRLQ